MNSGELLKAYRKQNGLTQTQLAKELCAVSPGFTASLVSYIENGIVELPQSVIAQMPFKTFEKPFRNPLDERKCESRVNTQPQEYLGSNRRFLRKDGKKMTQREQVLDYINTYGSITSREAFLDLGITQLAARIVELKKEGYRFDKKNESCKNRFGVDTWYVRYTLEKKEAS